MGNVVKSKLLMNSISAGDKSKEAERSENVAEGAKNADADASGCMGKPEGAYIVAGNISPSSSSAAKVRVNFDETWFRQCTYDAATAQANSLEKRTRVGEKKLVQLAD
jgi:hypothetical protein